LKASSFLLLLLLIFSRMQAENSTKEAHAQITVSPLNVAIQDQLNVTLHLTYPQNYSVDFSQLETNLLRHDALATAPFALLSKKISEQHASSSDIHETTILYTLQPQRLGVYPLTFFDISFKDKDKPASNPIELISDLFEVHVLAPTPADLKLISPTVPLPGFSYLPPVRVANENKKTLQEPIAELDTQAGMVSSPLFWCLIVLLILLGQEKVLEMIKGIFKRAEDKGLTVQAQKRRNLSHLIQKNIPKTETAQYYLELSKALRSNLEEIVPIKSQSLTIQEYSIKLSKLTPQNSPFDTKLQSKLKGILLVEEKVNFSGYSPSYEESVELQTTAVQVTHLKLQ